MIINFIHLKKNKSYKYIMYKTLIKNNNITTAILIFLVIFTIFIYIEPNFLFTKHGSIRHFGLGKRNSTIIPVWLLVIITAIIAYLLTLCYLRF